jgi:hypothetical protein
LGIYTAILQSLLSCSANMTVPPPARPVSRARACGGGARVPAARRRRARGAFRAGFGRILAYCTIFHPLYTRIANIFGTSISEATMRPDPRRGARSASGGAWRGLGSVTLSRCTTAHPLYTRFANRFGASFLRRQCDRTQCDNATGPQARRAAPDAGGLARRLLSLPWAAWCVGVDVQVILTPPCILCTENH